MFLVTLQKLSKPLSYLTIKHDQKFIVDALLPMLLAALSFFLIVSSKHDFNIVGDKGLIDHVNGLLQMLVGFFVASLAAVATFQRPGMDEPMQGIPPTLNGRGLTRREFLCYMFGYLAFVSIVTYLFSGVVKLSLPALKLTLSSNIYEMTSQLGLFGYLVVVFNILITTLLALFFLTDRIVRAEPQAPDIEED
ncbi:MAG: hypothetical protein HWE19_17780 [Vibrionaceae bacterium]|nr:hypothetical protein [Vibrionaceae bacterium]